MSSFVKLGKENGNFYEVIKEIELFYKHPLKDGGFENIFTNTNFKLLMNLNKIPISIVKRLHKFMLNIR